MKNILITGCRGFIGKNLTSLFTMRGWNWVDYDLINGKDIRNKHDLEYVFESNQIQYVIHMAALTGVRRSKLYPEEYISTNVLGTQNVVDLCSKYEVKKLVFFSSSSVFGSITPSPLRETSPKNPVNLYGITKLAGEHIVNNAECPTIIVRPFTVYGEHGKKDAVIYRWLEQYKNGLPITVYGDGSSCRGYILVNDLVRAVFSLLGMIFDSNKHEDFNLGGSEVVYLRDMIKIFKEELPDAKFVYLDMPKEDVIANYSNTDKAKEIIKFNPQPNFENNLREIIKKFKSQCN